MGLGMNTNAALLCSVFFLCAAASAKAVGAPGDSTSAPSSGKTTEEIVVVGKRDSDDSAERVLLSTESVLSNLIGVSLIRRSDIALEPSIRGMSAGQVAVTIDGMKMVGACVDRMDPVTAYVEMENLRSVGLSKGASDLSAAQTVGGTLALKTTRPEFGAPFSLRLKSTGGSAASLFRLYGETEWASDDITVRAAASLRRAGNYTAGGTTTIAGSGYTKENYKLDAGWKPASDQTLFFSAIVDNARDIGYPALIMDTRSARSLLAGLTYSVKNLAASMPELTTRVYVSTVRHFMDDYDRSKEEVSTRAIMPGMRMPMAGRSQTAGLAAEALFASETDWLRVGVESYRLDAIADMEMHSFDTLVPSMYLLNIADARLLNLGTTAEYYREFSSALRWRAALRVDYSARSLRNTDGRNALLASSAGMPGEKSYTALGMSTTMEFAVAPRSVVSVVVARTQRLPTHIENFGYYLYSPMDNAIYMGNTLLKPETSHQVDLTFSQTDSIYAASATVFGTLINDYIAGRTYIGADTANKLFPQAFRRYENVGKAVIAGVEASAAVQVARGWMLRATAAWQRGYAYDEDDNLPFMPPLSGTLRLVWTTSSAGRFELWSRLAAGQKQYSAKILNEDATPAFGVVDLRWTFDATSWCTLDAGVENIFDAYYYEHTSINNLPSPGRNMYATIELRY